VQFIPSKILRVQLASESPEGFLHALSRCAKRQYRRPAGASKRGTAVAIAIVRTGGRRRAFICYNTYILCRRARKSVINRTKPPGTIHACQGACLSIPRGREGDGFADRRGGADEVGYVPMRRRQRRMKANPSAPAGLALQGASAALRGFAVESTTAGAARLASAPLQSQRGSRGMLRQAPKG
jgi:hypothetical protein